MAASTSVISMSIPLTQTRVSTPSAFFNPLPLKVKSSSRATNFPGKFQVRASMKEKVVTGLTAAALTASMVIPDVAEAAESGGLSPSLKNFLLSIVSGGVVLVAILGAVIGVSNFDPVKRA